MWVRILGSAAGGGFPQWNCACPCCRAVRDGSRPCRPRTQSSIAVSGDYRRWFVFNASPDIRAQIMAFNALSPPASPRSSPIQGVLLTDAELDHTLGLLSLRETTSLQLYTTPWVRDALSSGSALLPTLGAYCAVDWHPVHLDASIPLPHSDGTESGVTVQAFSAWSAKSVLYAPHAVAHPESVIGHRITETSSGRAVVYLPGVAELHPIIQEQISNCTCLLLDGTFWRDDELVCLGIGRKTARDTGHLPIGEDGGSLEWVAHLAVPHRIYIHINNTNPVLLEDSPERRIVVMHGVVVATDGLELEV